jgi:ABC-type glutathione transport system ATPase component
MSGGAKNISRSKQTATDDVMEAAPLLSVRDLSVSFLERQGVLGRVREPRRVVEGVSFDLGAGESLGVVGESGSGKTTLGRAILRLISDENAAITGQVRFGELDVLSAGRREVRGLRRQMQIIYQDPGGSLNPRHRIASILAEPIEVHGLERGREAISARVHQLLDQVGLPSDAGERYPHEFSGGQKQRIAIARALAVKPKLIVCDEPTSALDVSIQAQILNLLSDLQREHGLAYLFISHDLAVVNHLCPRIAVMQAGRIVEVGPRERVLSKPDHEYTRMLISAVPKLEPRSA